MAYIINTAKDNIETLGPVRTHFVYNALDACVTHEIDTVLDETFPAELRAQYKFHMALQAPAMEMMLRGMLVQPEEKELMIIDFSERAHRYDAILQKFANAVWDRDLNPNSPKQLQDFFYGCMKLPPQTINVKGVRKVSTNRECLEKLSVYYYAAPFVNLILSLRDCYKRLSVLRKGIDSDGRMRSAYNICGTETGRWSSSENAFGTGDNAQNQTEAVRHIYIADPGMKMCYVDLEQAESRAVAALSGDENYWHACHSGDLHTTVTKMVWRNLQWMGELKKDIEIAEQIFYRQFSYRDMAKRGGHGSNYYGTPWTMAKHLKVPSDVMVKFQQEYFTAFPGIRRWHQAVLVELQTKGIITTPLEFRRCFFGRRDDDATLREAIAFGPQSLVAQILNLGMWLVWWNIPQIQLLAQVHDAILFQYPEELESILIPRVLDLMQIPVTINGRVLCIPAEAAVGWNWGKYLDETKAAKRKTKPNPHGLRKLKELPNGTDTRQRPAYSKASLLDRIVL